MGKKSSYPDPVGQKFGRLLVLEDAGMVNHQRMLRCQCDCGAIILRDKYRIYSRLKKNGVPMCYPCAERENAAPSSVGLSFGRLTVIQELSRKNKKVQVLCECSCPAKTRIVRNSANALRLAVKYGMTPSCGCYLHEVHSKYGIVGAKREYMSWFAARDRCFNPGNDNYEHYGARGITMCAEWANDDDGFSNFFRFMGKKPTRRHTLERKDVNGNYEPSNCEWATMKTQANNKRTTVFYEFRGQRLTLSQIHDMKLSDVSRNALWKRLNSGWTPEDAVMTPSPKQHRFLFRGVMKSLYAVSKETGVDYYILYGRVVNCRWDIERAVSEPVKSAA